MLFYIEDARIFYLILRKSFSKTVSSAKYFQHLLFGLKLVQHLLTLTRHGLPILPIYIYILASLMCFNINCVHSFALHDLLRGDAKFVALVVKSL